ncbi:MAG TPA: hypothetical protein VM425_04510 [Myxococcota bacterium]|nr:hypothetical protein [Myxococcota bacterium]
MSLPDPREQLLLLRHILGPLVDNFELDDPGRGVVGLVKVSGGVFVHPLSREAVPGIRVYGAGSDRVKIIEPLFLRSLGRITVSGLTHPSQFCARVAERLSAALIVLGEIRDSVAALGIHLYLDHDFLRLSGSLDLDRLSLRLSAWEPRKLVVCGLGEHDLTGWLPRGERTIELSGNAPADLDELARLTRGVDERIRRETVEAVERSLGEMGANEEAQEVTDEPAPPEPASETAAPEAPAAGSHGADGFAAGKSDVLELTETVDEAHALQPEPSLGPVCAAEIIDKLGSEASISAFGGKLRIEVPLKVIQGTYRFYLEQRGPTLLRGYMITPGDRRYDVEFDLRKILDLKEVLDRVLMNK